MFDLGDPVPLTFEVTGAATVVLTLELPDGSSVTPSVTTPGAGRYVASYVPVQAGLHRVRWTATGSLTDAFTDVFNVRLPGDLQLISLADAKAHLNMKQDVDDEELRGWIAAATGVIERHTGEIVARREFTETAVGPRVRLDKFPLIEVTDPVGVTIIDAAISEINTGTSGSVEVVYTAGYRVVPENILGAAAIIAAHLFDTQRMGSLGRVNLSGEEAPVPSAMGYAVPNRAAQLLGGHPPVCA